MNIYIYIHTCIHIYISIYLYIYIYIHKRLLFHGISGDTEAREATVEPPAEP